MAGSKIIAESLTQHNEKHVVPTLLSGISVGRRKIQEQTAGLISMDLMSRCYLLTMIEAYDGGGNNCML
jgi:hypothetical protein